MKFVTRFKKIKVGTKQNWDYQKSCLKEINLWDTKIVESTPLTKKDVSLYFKNIRPKFAKVGEYCERCGILIGEQYQNKKPRKYKRFLVCNGCYDKKRSKCKESTPDLEDVKRFGIELI